MKAAMKDEEEEEEEEEEKEGPTGRGSGVDELKPRSPSPPSPSATRPAAPAKGTSEGKRPVRVVARSLREGPADVASSAPMGLRGKDRLVTAGGRAGARSARVEEGALVPAKGSGSFSPDDLDREEEQEEQEEEEEEGRKESGPGKKGRASFWRSRGMVLFVVFMALLLDETLMTVIVPIVPDYLLDHCLEERCQQLNLSSAPDCKDTPYPAPADAAMATPPIVRRTDWPPDDVPTPSPSTAAIGQRGHAEAATSTVGGASSPSRPAQSAVTTNVTSSPVVSDSPLPDVEATPSTSPSVEDVCLEEVVPRAGVLFASKFVVRIIMSPFVGTFAHKIGFSALLLSGCLIMIVSSFVFAFGVSYEALLAARIVHGIGATLNEIGGLGLIAYEYRDDEKGRGFALGLAIGGFAAGTLIGPPFGGICYDFLGKASPFLFMVGFLVALAVLELVALNPRSKQRQTITKGRPMYKLILDPYILATAGALAVASGVVALLEPTLPIWMRTNIHPTPDAWQLGAVFLPSGVSYIISSTIMGYLGYRIGRWSLSMLALVVLAVSVAAVPYTGTFLELMGPMVGTGFGFGTVDSTMTAMLNSRVDARHKGAYGGAAAISTFAFCLGFAIGPSISGFLSNAIGFKWLMRGIAILTLLYAPICIFLRRPSNAGDVTASAGNNNAYAPGNGSDDVIMGEAEAVPIPSISRRLSRV